MKAKLVNIFICIVGLMLCSVGAAGFMMALANWGWWLIAGLGSLFAGLIAENS